ncbi:MAG: hypothetical protein JNN04_17445 [Cyclobacteriaceae bacterium]|nr:hypothetical protein [Cyclobacteriaceae bacterium]
MKHSILLTLGLFLIPMAACSVKEDPPSGRDGWLKGTPHEKLDVVAKQLRGFDMTMVETGYRYQELYWAGTDGNWEYAEYQVEKIKQAIEYGLERRPKRAASAEPFLRETLPQLENLVKSKDSVGFLSGYEMLTKQCNACHKEEEVPFFTVKPPLHRQSPIRGR